jgi:N-methylhydantoinase A
MSQYRVGVDIGSTFTDFALLDESTGAIATLKISSTPQSPATAVVDGLRLLARRRGIDPAAITYFVHGTTLAVNALIERSGSRVGLLVTEGFEDLMDLRRLRLPDPQNFFADPPVPLVPRDDVRGLTERMTAAGTVERPLDLAQVEAAASELIGVGCSALGVCLLHSYANDQHERSVKAVLAERFPALYVCTSAEVWPQRREYERALLTAINAHVGEKMRRYFRALEEDLGRLGLRAPVLSTKSNGGIMTARTAGDRPVETLFSGPASGVIGAHWTASQAGFSRIITFDMGGTSADVSVVTDTPTYSTEAQAGDFPILMPAIDVRSIGAGGGSIAWVDGSGVLKVGPQSAGSDPGPACYGRGGAAPTVTDAYLALGWLNPARFGGGDLRLIPEDAVAALTRLGTHLGLGVKEVAWAIVEIATANMHARFTPFLASRGADAQDYVIVAFGGAGPTHVFLLAQEVGLSRVIIPTIPGALCALGCLAADLRADFVRTFGNRCDRLAPSALEAAYGGLEAEARTWLENEGVPVQAARFERSAEMRYVGQSFELRASLPEGPLASLDAMLEAFYEAYEQTYGYADREAPVEIVDLRVQVVGRTPKPRLQRTDGGGQARSAAHAAPATRRISWANHEHEARIYDRTALRPGDLVRGPVVIEQDDTTTVVPPGFHVRVDGYFNLIGEAAS